MKADEQLFVAARPFPKNLKISNQRIYTCFICLVVVFLLFCQDVVVQLTDLLGVAQALISDVTSEELPEWKQRQQIACIGGPPNACVDQLQKW